MRFSPLPVALSALPALVPAIREGLIRMLLAQAKYSGIAHCEHHNENRSRNWGGQSQRRKFRTGRDLSYS